MILRDSLHIAVGAISISILYGIILIGLAILIPDECVVSITEHVKSIAPDL